MVNPLNAIRIIRLSISYKNFSDTPAQENVQQLLGQSTQEGRQSLAMGSACSPCATWYRCFIIVTFLLHLFCLKQVSHCISQAAVFFIRQQFNSWKPFRFLHICTPLTPSSLHRGFHVSIFLSDYLLFLLPAWYITVWPLCPLVLT